MTKTTDEIKLAKLVKKHDFSNATEYYEYCIDSYINGQMKQCLSLLTALPKTYRRDLLNHIEQTIGIADAYSFYVNKIILL